MLEVGITYQDIDLLLYTHIHPDHISDLVPILFACKYTELPRERNWSVLEALDLNAISRNLKRSMAPGSILKLII